MATKKPNVVTKTSQDGAAAGKEEHVTITPARMEVVKFRLVGTTPLVQNRFGEKARQEIQDKHERGSQAKKGKNKEPRDFDDNYQQARHVSVGGWDGIHAGGFRRAMVDSCKLVGFHMTKAKLGLFVPADGYTADGTPLVRITKGEPRKVIHAVRNASGVCDLRARPMWDAGWECVLTVRYDADMFSATEVLNLVARVGLQCGIGEGRPNSKESTGCDWGLFDVRTA